MTNEEIKKFIAERVEQGISLSKIQDALLAEKKVKLTFMEVRMIAAELDNAELAKLDKPEDKKPEVPAEPAPAEDPLPEEGALPEDLAGQEKDVTEALNDAAAKDGGETIRGTTTVEISKVVKPGTMLNGTVNFGSGVTADWVLDQMGRIGLSNVKGGKPDELDIQEFQLELQKKLGA